MYRFGITSDDPRDGVKNPSTNTKMHIDALRSFRQRVMLRVVFDPDQEPESYKEAVVKLSAVCDIVGCLLDSSAMDEIEDCKARADAYVEALGEYISVWEVGNEVNGDWLGSEVPEKIQDMYIACSDKATMLTLYYAKDFEGTEYDLITWVEKNVPEDMREGLTYVTVSYYEDQNENGILTPEKIEPVFAKLSVLFPNSFIGFGECGYGRKIPTSAKKRKQLIERFYTYESECDRFFGGGFWWHGRQTMVPRTKADWSVINDLMEDL